MGIMIHGRHKIHRNSADGVIPVAEKNFMIAVSKLSCQWNNQQAITTVLKGTFRLTIFAYISSISNSMPWFDQT